MSQREIAGATGASEATVSRDLHTENTPSDQVTRYVGVTPEPGPKTPAQRMRKHRASRRYKASDQARTTPVTTQTAAGNSRAITGRMPVTGAEWDEVNDQFAAHAEVKLKEKHDQEVAGLERRIRHLEEENEELEAVLAQAGLERGECQGTSHEGADRSHGYPATAVRLDREKTWTGKVCGPCFEREAGRGAWRWSRPVPVEVSA